MSIAEPGRPTRVLVRPFYPDFLGDKIFAYTHAYSDRWMEPYVRWRELATSRGFELATWDRFPLETADVVVFMDLPDSRREVAGARARAPRAKFILMLVESPLGRPHAFNPSNHAAFDAVLTYNWRLCDERRYFRYYLPVGSAPPPADPPFADRRPLVMVNTNRLLGPLGMLSFRHPGLAGLPGLGPLFRDWSVTPGAFVGQVRGELYSRRRGLARTADREFPGVLDVFGPGWRGEPIGWVHKFARPRPFACARGPLPVKKDELLPRYRFAVAFENAVADVGYISEKVFDALLAGVVPLYLGDARVAENIDPACYVDATKFASDRELLAFVRDCPEAEWRRMRDAGRAYVGSPAARKFQSEAFAARMVEVLERVCGA
jgi:hypothetical protein